MKNRVTSSRASSAWFSAPKWSWRTCVPSGPPAGSHQRRPGGVSGQPDGVVTVVCFRADQVIRERSSQRTWLILRGTWWPGDGHRPATRGEDRSGKPIAVLGRLSGLRRGALLDRLVQAGVLPGHDVPLEVVLTGRQPRTTVSRHRPADRCGITSAPVAVLAYPANGVRQQGQ
jgi:hypothetical protein